MADTIFYDTLGNQNDTRWNNTDSWDITSIVDALECGNVDKIIGNNIPDISLILLDDLNNIDNWLLKTLYPGIFHVKFIDLQKSLVLKLGLVRRHLDVVFNLLIQNNKKVFQSNNDYKCNNFCVVCNDQINIENYDLLSHIERHEHFMQVLNDKNCIKKLKEKHLWQPLWKLKEINTNINEQDNPGCSQHFSGETTRMQSLSTAGEGSTKKHVIQIKKGNSPKCSKGKTEQSDKKQENTTDFYKHVNTEMDQLIISETNELNELQRRKEAIDSTQRDSQGESEGSHKKDFKMNKNVDQSLQSNSSEDSDNEASSETSTSSLNYQKYPESSSAGTKEIFSVLYPSSIIHLVQKLQKSNVLTIQNIKPNIFRCLLCIKDLKLEELSFHINSNNHIQQVQTRYSCMYLRRYHEYFATFPRFLAIHQTCLVPVQMKYYKCKICHCNVGETNILEHINGMRHRQIFLEKPSNHSLYFFDEMIQSFKESLIENYIKNNKPQPPLATIQASTSNSESEKKHHIVLSFMENPQTVFEHLERRLQEHKKFIKVKESKYHCTICDILMPMHKEVLKTHLISQTHLKYARRDISRHNWVFFCDLCPRTERTEIKWYEHLNSVVHKQRLETIRKSGVKLKGGDFVEYECYSCLTVICGNEFSLIKHMSENVTSHKKKKKEIKLPIQLEKLLKDTVSLDEKMLKMIKESDKTIEKKPKHMECCRAIEKVLHRLFPACRAYPFGSRVSGIGCMSSDLDIFVDTGMMYDGFLYQDDESQTNIVRMVTKELRKHPEFTYINPIPNARTPIVQVFHKNTDLDCDLSFRHGLSVENTDYLRLCIDVQPIVQPLILILKHWSHECGFDKISTYAMAMKAIFYMQTKNYLPTIKMIREIDHTPCRVIAGWQTFRFTKDLEEIDKYITKCNLNPRDLLKDFFDYYTKFNYEENVICPLLGKLVLKEDFREDNLKLPVEMKSYIDKIKKSEQAERFRHHSPMCIQDPFDLSHNLTKACPMDYVTRFQQYCLLSYQALAGENTHKDTNQI